MIWLLVTWLALIVIWGGSEAWHLGAMARRVVHRGRPRPHAAAVHPFDWADPGNPDW